MKPEHETPTHRTGGAVDVRPTGRKEALNQQRPTEQRALPEKLELDPQKLKTEFEYFTGFLRGGRGVLVGIESEVTRSNTLFTPRKANADLVAAQELWGEVNMSARKIMLFKQVLELLPPRYWSILAEKAAHFLMKVDTAFLWSKTSNLNVFFSDAFVVDGLLGEELEEVRQEFQLPPTEAHIQSLYEQKRKALETFVQKNRTEFEAHFNYYTGFFEEPGFAISEFNAERLKDLKLSLINGYYDLGALWQFTQLHFPGREEHYDTIRHFHGMLHASHKFVELPVSEMRALCPVRALPLFELGWAAPKR